MNIIKKILTMNQRQFILTLYYYSNPNVALSNDLDLGVKLVIRHFLPEIEFEISYCTIKFHTEEDLFRFNMWLLSLGEFI